MANRETSAPPSPARISPMKTPQPDRPRRREPPGRVHELPAERVARLRSLLFVAGGMPANTLSRVASAASLSSDDEVFVNPRKRRLER